MEKEKINDLISLTMELGFNMGAVSMRLKMMEALTPYIDNNLIDSQLITVRDIIKIMADTMTDYDIKKEFAVSRTMMEGMNNGNFPPKL